MARGRRTSLTICLTPAQRQTLLAWQRATTITAGLARRVLRRTMPHGVPVMYGAQQPRVKRGCLLLGLSCLSIVKTTAHRPPDTPLSTSRHVDTMP